MRVPARRRAPMCARVYNYSRKLANTALVATERASNRALDRCPATAPAIATAAQALPRARRSAARRRRRRRTRCALPPPGTIALQPATTLPRAAQKRKRKDEKESKKSKKSKKEKKGKDKKEKKGKDKKEKRSKREKERAKLVETATGAHHCRPATDRAPVPTSPLRRWPRRRWVGQVRHHQGGRHVHEAGGVPLLAGRRQGGHPRYSPTVVTHDTHPLYSLRLYLARLHFRCGPPCHLLTRLSQGVVYEHCGQRDLKEHFDSFCEDYNTATMPSKKYYNIQAWHAAEQAKGRKKKVRDARAHRLLTFILVTL